MGKIHMFPDYAATRCYAVEMYRHGAVAKIDVVPSQFLCAEGRLTIEEERK